MERPFVHPLEAHKCLYPRDVFFPRFLVYGADRKKRKLRLTVFRIRDKLPNKEGLFQSLYFSRTGFNNKDWNLNPTKNEIKYTRTEVMYALTVTNY